MADENGYIPIDEHYADNDGTDFEDDSTDFADQFPHAEVIGIVSHYSCIKIHSQSLQRVGTDLSPIQPSFGIPNLSFEIDDCCSAWTYPPNSFDFIHVRGLYGSVEDWPEFYRECMKCLKPGGYIEQLEFSILAKCDDGSSANNEALRKWGEYGFEVGEKFGKTFKVVDKMKGWIEDGGFEDVVEHRYKWPIGSWSSDPKLKDIGRWNLVHWEEGIEGWCLAGMTRLLGFSFNQVQAFLVELRLALRNRNYHLYQEVGVVYARKPLQP
ncbi:MAG: hypothetical protein M1835_003468 [Candelina submexicana]|nr:MAG: hypothetical protein M1835_003468 [Candelina submexicana]